MTQAPPAASAPPSPQGPERSVGLWGATGVGIGAIVGGGILILAGVAFRAAGPSTIVAFALNGVISLLTALCFAEMSSAFPESGGAYVYAKKVLSVRAAFVVGWVVWFAYIVAGVLYGLGFSSFLIASVNAWGYAPAWLATRGAMLVITLVTVAAFTILLIRRSTGGAEWATWGKLLVFGVLILAGVWAGVRGDAAERVPEAFFAGGAFGVLSAMGFTFTALQGFEVIATIAGEVREPRRILPRAMLLSLGAALCLYIPLLLVISSVGVPAGETLHSLSERYPDTVMAVAVGNYLGRTGFWLVMVAALLSTLSALHASLLAASRVSLTMARDRTLPPVLMQAHGTTKTPVVAIYTSALAMVTVTFAIPDLAAAGAAASLIFLTSFALAHATSILARLRNRSQAADSYRTPLFPLVPVTGGLACTALALFQAFTVPAAGGIAALWLGLGVLLYLALFSSRARTVDALAEGQDPNLLRLRGHTPLILVPIANPETAPGLVAVANALTPAEFGKVLLLTVVIEPADGSSDARDQAVQKAQSVLGSALRAALASGHQPEALLSVARAPWSEITRVARSHRCQGVLLGRPSVDAAGLRALEDVMSSVDCDVTFLCAHDGWRLADVTRVLVPVGGRGQHSELRARLLGSLSRVRSIEVVWLSIVTPHTSDSAFELARRRVFEMAEHVTTGAPRVLVERAQDFGQAVAAHCQPTDLLVLGLRRPERGRRVFGELALRIASQVSCATVVISRGS
ncbi:MAG TPA: amino acid permease [Polyangiaceae bacterium]|nr:amino acid permease [Polyangiaceae bacterium]